MNEDASPRLLATAPTEFEAKLIAVQLSDQGIRVETAGAMISGFKAEVPAGVSILVPQAQLDKAKKLLERFRAERSQVDWSQIDVGEPES